ncbi:hypothetical protein BDV23DRAFT_186674 [Aspergillus alliaceus]|uniref:Uncharacterized protein n=1 Tax=Petromyces alliaceus TaxID=209559 RepID=A0A5N7BZT5_PETAA|nr:hypothetical protein BDV23DRAFT_186674 [Aspergillus alliaceus]
MEVNDQGPFEISVPQDIFWSKTLVEDAQRTYLYGPRNRTLDIPVRVYMAHALATPAHKKHMSYFSSAMEEIDLGQINNSEKHWNCRSLGTLEDTVNFCFARHLLPES